MKEDRESLQLSGIQHFFLCRRRWALIHIEKQWVDNVLTIEGDIFHENAHDGKQSEKRGDIITTRGLEVFSREMAINGICDVVEFYRSSSGVPIRDRDGLWQPVPVEYKKGKPNAFEADGMQLCAQAMCLEEMLACNIKEAYVYYGEQRHRLKLDLTSEMKEKIKTAVSEMHQMYERNYTPSVRQTKFCKSCSLADICLPKLNIKLSIGDYIDETIHSEAFSESAEKN